MTQNTSHAVMAQRHENKESLDDFPTPPWAARALVEHVILEPRVAGQVCWEPAANRGYLTRGLNDYFRYVIETDIANYGNNLVADFLDPESCESDCPIDWIITNPPFNKAQQFIERALPIARDGVAMLVRTSFMEGVMRYQTLFLARPPDVVAQFSERVPMVRGRCDPKASTATSYAWFVWYVDGVRLANKSTLLTWIPPCRKTLERPGDYD